MDKYKFGNRLCFLREEKGLSQKELAKILDVSDKAISKWENGQSIPRMETLEKLAEAFNVRIEVLLNDDETEIERYRVKRSVFRNKDFGFKNLFYFLGFGSISIVALACIVDTFVYIFFNKSNLAYVLLQNIMLLAIPIGLLTVMAFINSWLLRFISGFKDFIIGTGNCITVQNLAHRGLSLLNGVTGLMAILPFVIVLTTFEDGYSLIQYVILYFVSLVLLTINILTSKYSNTSLYFTENGVFEKSISYGEFHPYSKLQNVESNIADINSAKTQRLKVSFTSNDKKFKVSVYEKDIYKLSSYLKIKYDEKQVEENEVKPKALYYVIIAIGVIVMAFGGILFLSNLQMGTQEVEFTKPSTEFVALDGGTSVVKYNERLYAFTDQNCAVDVFDMDGNFLYANRVPIHQNGGAEFYLVNDNLYIIDRDYTIYRYDLNGNFLGRLNCINYEEGISTMSRYDKDNKLVKSYELELDYAYPVYFDDETEMIYCYDYMLTYDGNEFTKTNVPDYELRAEYVDGAVYQEKYTNSKFDGVEYYTFRGSLIASSDDEYKELYKVPVFSWYRHSIGACWFTAACGMLFIFVSTRIYTRIAYKKKNNSN